MKLLLPVRGAAPSPPAVQAVLAVALRMAVARWGNDFIRDTLTSDATPKVRGRLAKFRLAALTTDSLRAACALVHADPVLVAARLRDRLAASLDDVIAASEPVHLTHRVRQLVEEAWPRFFDVFAEELTAEGEQR